MPVYSNNMPVGTPAPNFSLPGIDGQTYSLESFASAQVLVVVFTCNHCPYAKACEARLIAIQRDYADRGVQLVAINPNDPEVMPEDSFDEMKKRATEKKYPFPYLLDEKQEVYPRYGATRTPHVFVLDSTRHVRYIGTVDDNAESVGNVKKRYVENAINALLRGDDPEPATTKAIGCMIRHK